MARNQHLHYHEQSCNKTSVHSNQIKLAQPLQDQIQVCITNTCGLQVQFLSTLAAFSHCAEIASAAVLMGLMLMLSFLSSLIYNQDGCYSMVSVGPYGYLILTRPAVLQFLYIASCLASGFLIFCSISWVVYKRKEKEIKVCVYCASWRLIFPYEQV